MSRASQEGYVKRVFDCGHWTLIPDYFARQDHCPHCPGKIVEETDPSESDFQSVTWV